MTEEEEEFLDWEKTKLRIDTAWESWKEKQDPDSIFNVEPLVEHFPDEVAFEGEVTIVDQYGSDYTSEALVSPTWGTLLIELRKMIRHTGNIHTCFLEGAGYCPGSDKKIFLDAQ